MMELFVCCLYADDADNSLLVNDMRSPVLWNMGDSYLVGFTAYHDTPDTTAQPFVNIMINGGGVSNHNGSLGVEMPGVASWVANPNAAIDRNNYLIKKGDSLEIACTQAGGSGDAKDVSVSCIFVT